MLVGTETFDDFWTILVSLHHVVKERVVGHEGFGKSRFRSRFFQHIGQCAGAKISTNVIAKARDNTSLRFKEALLTHKKRPQINAKRQIDELLSLTLF